MEAFEQTDWPENARRLANRFPLSVLHPRAVEWLTGSAWKGPAGVTCSGGADSLSLLLLVWAHLPERRDRLVVMHFDHRLRGEASREDSRFTGEVAGSLGLAFRAGSWERDEEGQVSEEAARRARFAFFEQELKTCGGDALLFGHQRDDIVESLLMRLSRGSGTAGLAAPRPLQRFPADRVHVRPLLSLPGREIRQVLEELRIPYRTDATNDEAHFYRNRVRRDVLPAWQAHSPFDVAAGAAASRELLEEDDEALETWLRELLTPPEAGRPLDLGPLAGKPRALARRALREWLGVEGLAQVLAKGAFEELLDAVYGGDSCKMSAGKGVFLEVEQHRVSRKGEGGDCPSPPLGFERPWPLPCHGTLLLPGGGALAARRFLLDPERRACILSGRVESRREAFIAFRDGQMHVRFWLSGDRFRPLGAPGSRKLQDAFVDRKIPEAERRRLPVVLCDNEIIWVPGFPPAEVFKINDLTNEVVQLTYKHGETV